MHNVVGGGEFQIYRHILKWDNFNSFILQNFKSCINTPITSLCILSFSYHSLRFDLEHGSTCPQTCRFHTQNWTSSRTETASESLANDLKKIKFIVNIIESTIKHYLYLNVEGWRLQCDCWKLLAPSLVCEASLSHTGDLLVGGNIISRTQLVTPPGSVHSIEPLLQQGHDLRRNEFIDNILESYNKKIIYTWT